MVSLSASHKRGIKGKSLFQVLSLLSSHQYPFHLTITTSPSSIFIVWFELVNAINYGPHTLIPKHGDISANSQL
jgi:hypothetical protein